MTSTLVLLRHGQSEWNQKNIFTGWVDVDLSEAGVNEARRVYDALKDFHFDAVFTSGLVRAQKTAKLALGERLPNSEYVIAPELNERRYGELEGKNKDEMREHYGAMQIEIWRRSFTGSPPGGESLRDTCERVVPYFIANIIPRLQQGQTILIAAHGNSLRALIKYLEAINDDDIVSVEIKTGQPIVYTFDSSMRIISKKIVTP